MDTKTEFLAQAMQYADQLRTSKNDETADLLLMLAMGVYASGNIDKNGSAFLAEEKMYELSNDLFGRLQIQPGNLEVALNTLRAIIDNTFRPNRNAEMAPTR